jgi:hypothetical protein
MASPSSGDDYYASLGNEPTQASGNSEKKKIIKIVAKKASVSPAETPAISEKSQEIVSKIDALPVSDAEPEMAPPLIEKVPEVQPYVSRTVKLPESGTLDLGGKFSSGPVVVFHTHNALPKPLGSRKM